MMPRSRIHVRRDIIASDRKTGEIGKPIGVETTGMRKRYGRSVTVLGESRIVYRPDKPLRCGATAWIETTADVIVHQE